LLLLIIAVSKGYFPSNKEREKEREKKKTELSPCLNG
jgi:hypothetical protein